MNANARRKRRRRARRRLARIVVVLALAGGGFGLARAIAWPGFTLHKLVIDGLHDVPRSEIVSRAHIDPHANVWLMNTGAVCKRLAAIPRVLEAHVHRSLPGTVRIEVMERRAVGCVVGSDGRRVTIDETRRILTEGCEPAIGPTYVPGSVVSGEPATIITDVTLERLRNDDRLLEAGGRRFARLAFDRFGDLDAQLTSGVTIRFGDDGDLARKDRLVAPILRAVAAHLGHVRAIDLRSVTSPVVEFRDAGVRSAAGSHGNS